jgi:uncharacterized protein (UPF0262 family)
MGEVRAPQSGSLVAVEIDPGALVGPESFLEAERTVAIRDLVAENRFLPAGRSGAFRLRLSITGRMLVLDVADAEGAPVVRHILSLKPLSRVMRDYFLICESHTAALANTSPARIEAIDMGRRGIHDEGAAVLQGRLAGKIDIDFATARRLFTLVCALNWRGRHEA